MTVSSVVPSHNMKSGDFSELSPTSYPLNSLATGQSGCITTATMKIAAGCIDPVGSKLAALYPDPNDPHVPVWTGATNYNFVYDSPTQNNSGDVRIDSKLRENDTIFGRYSILHQHRQDPPWTSNFVSGNGGFATDYVIHNQGLALGWTHIFSTTALNQARYGFLRDNAHSNPIGVTLGTSNAADYGLTGIPASPLTAGLPPLYISGLVTLGTDRFRPRKTKGATGVTACVSLMNDRSFFTYVGENTRLTQILRSDSILDSLTSTRHVHFALPLDHGLAQVLLPPLRAAG